MTRLWLKIIKNHRIDRHFTAPCEYGDIKSCLNEMCREADLPCPIWLDKHENEFLRFRKTAFSPDHFIESVDFDRLEIDFLDDSDTKRKSADPRNQF